MYPVSILIAEDDADDRLMLDEAFAESGVALGVCFAQDGQELMDRLAILSDRTGMGLPGLIVLDLNMPKKDGREALREIKQHPKLNHIPVVVLTTSKSPEDVRNAYRLGASCYITKPTTYEALMTTVRAFNTFWFETVRLPQTTDTK